MNEAPSAVCPVCPRHCRLGEGETGYCRARRAEGGRVVAGNYGRVTALALDPIEKKPIAFFRPGSRILSVGSYGCNLRCPFCQNDSISQCGESTAEFQSTTPAELADLAERLGRAQGNVGLAYTYNEPLVGWEFVRDCAVEIRRRGMCNVLVSNGCAEAEVVAALAPLIDAANIDLKCFSDEGYRALGGSLDAVKRTIEALAASSACHLEVTTLVVPGLSDDAAHIDASARWIASIDRGIPYHLTRFFPRHNMADAQPTPIPTLHHLRNVASQYLDTVLLGNV